jgi:hypothetical protein
MKLWAKYLWSSAIANLPTSQITRTRLDWHLLLATPYIVSGRATAQKTLRCPAMDIWEPHRKSLLRHWFDCCIHSTVAQQRKLSICCMRIRCLEMGLYVTVNWGKYLGSTKTFSYYALYFSSMWRFSVTISITEVIEALVYIMKFFFSIVTSLCASR